MIEDLKEPLQRIKLLLKEIDVVNEAVKKVSGDEKRLMSDYIDNTKAELRIISDSIPGVLAKKKKKIFRVELTDLEKKDYLKEVGMEYSELKKTKKKIERMTRAEKEKKKEEAYKKPGFFVRTASKMFSSISLRLEKNEFFQGINNSLRKANMPFLISTYISTAMLSAVISFFIAIILFFPLFIMFGAIAFLLAFAPVITFFIVLFYPASEISSIRMKIDDELPFATMHMSAIASSGVEPSKVFSILAASPEYPTVRKEMRKVVNMINFYGYDLSTALKVTAKTTSSAQLAELLGGMASTISGGGDLRSYLDKIAADSLLDYKLRRRKFITVSETYADIYTGLLIAAPLMFMLILVLMNVVTGNIGGMSSATISMIGIGAIVLLNIGFLIFLEISQPSA